MRKGFNDISYAIWGFSEGGFDTRTSFDRACPATEAKYTISEVPSRISGFLVGQDLACHFLMDRQDAGPTEQPGAEPPSETVFMNASTKPLFWLGLRSRKSVQFLGNLFRNVRNPFRERKGLTVKHYGKAFGCGNFLDHVLQLGKYRILH